MADPSGLTAPPSTAAERWRAAMRDWAVPEAILADAPESPWGFPTELFRSRARSATPDSLTYSNRRALERLDSGGTVLDVGAGGGAASLPLAARAGRLVGVDESPDLLAAFAAEAQRRGVAAVTVPGSWPAVSAAVEVADVAVCHHVVYNVQDLAPFLTVLSAHSRRRVVLEMTERHPACWMADLWLRFHELERPTGPGAADVVAVLRELGLDVSRHSAVVPGRPGGFARRDDAVAWIRRRLCLGVARDPEVAAALGPRLVRHEGLWSIVPPREPTVTVWWEVDGTA